MTETRHNYDWEPVGKWLKRARERLELSRKAVVLDVGATERSLARWEDEGTPPPADMFLALLWRYGVGAELPALLTKWERAARSAASTGRAGER